MYLRIRRSRRAVESRRSAMRFGAGFFAVIAADAERFVYQQHVGCLTESLLHQERNQVAGFGRVEPVRKGDPLPGGTAVSVGPHIAISTTHWGTQAQLNSASGPKGLFVGRTSKVPSLARTASSHLPWSWSSSPWPISNPF